MEENDESIISIIDRKLNIGTYKKNLMDKGMLNASRLFSTPIFSISYQTSVPLDICQQILDTVAQTILPDIVDFTYTPPRGKFNDPILDNSIFIPDSGIVEFCGLAGSGKSNLLFQLAINQRIFDISRNVIFVATEGKVPTQRLFQIAEFTQSPYSQDEILNGIIITEANCVEELLDIVQSSIPELFLSTENPSPSLIIIDSIAALFRIEYDINSAPAKSKMLFDITTTLKWLCSSYNALVLVSNQATANMSAFSSYSNDWLPALGFSWSNCINVRLRVNKTQMRHEIEQTQPITTNQMGAMLTAVTRTAPVRTIYVEISPYHQDTRAEFYIDNAGIHGI
ncbi:DNA repair protein XRCC3 [Histomonas meleagridis]|uniref:DNA repair protein XRCC3-like n=1 Tax=Histomonas meleagridis TaxID=135588 RepID=UPI003559BB07|nr:DNA repair protein XRCC3 [Histomonas meleagridis]KAH0802115.1 DNA repair protein XRCC3-like [Histomonas meleagridis]